MFPNPPDPGEYVRGVRGRFGRGRRIVTFCAEPIARAVQLRSIWIAVRSTRLRAPDIGMFPSISMLCRATCVRAGWLDRAAASTDWLVRSLEGRWRSVRD